MHITQNIKRAVQTNANGIATIFQDRQQTWAQFQRRIARFAGALHTLGVQREDRVAILALNSDRYLEYFYAVPWAGAIMVPMNTRWSVSENIYALADSGARILLVDDNFLAYAQEIQNSTQQLDTLVYIGDGATPKGMLCYETLIAEAEPAEDAIRRDLDLVGIFYTGGTTGFPKGVMTTIKGFQYFAVLLLSQYAINHHSRSLHAAPMFHLADAYLNLPTTAAAGTHVIVPAFAPDAVLKSIATHRVTHTLIVPTMIKMLLDEPLIDTLDISSLQRIVYGASSITETLITQAMDKMPHASFTQSYGQSEAVAVTMLNPEDHNPALGLLRSCGRAAPGNEVYIVDDQQNELPRGDVGEIMIRSPNRMLGYWNKPEQTAKALVNGAVLTGDVGYMDDNGYIFIQDRLKDMIITGGENVYSAEVENALSQHPAVADCAVIGLADEKWGEIVHAVVILQSGQSTTGEELITHCQGLIARYKCPRSVSFRTEPLPLSAAGKVMKLELRKEYGQVG
ncbi:MAG: long-chain fatty acid--CoA ligase [Gammaproteobacteria bacterium]|nr:long-chain fatty acid--CoA ligase [Gammaproteobacteria bacterium]